MYYTLTYLLTYLDRQTDRGRQWQCLAGAQNLDWGTLKMRTFIVSSEDSSRLLHMLGEIVFIHSCRKLCQKKTFCKTP